MLKREIVFTLLFLVLRFLGTTQSFVGMDLASLLGKTGEVHIMAFPHNEDWLSFDLSGGYTLRNRLAFPRKEDFLDNYSVRGWHARIVARNNLTYDHNRNHLFWGLGAGYCRIQESAEALPANPTYESGAHSHSLGIASGIILAGWSWNPVRKHTIYDYLKLDFGLQIGVPFAHKNSTFGERNYLPGFGWGYFPFRHTNLSPFIMARWEISRRHYGYKPGKTSKRFS